MSRWFRFYAEALDDPKVQRLSPHLFKAWVNLLCLGAAADGALPSNDDIAFRLRVSCQDAESITSDLVLAGLIDIRPNGTLAMHNWEGRQYASDSSAERTRKYRQKKNKTRGAEIGDGAGDGVGDVTVTVQSRSRADTDTELAAPLPLTSEKGEQQDLKIGFEKGRLAEAKREAVREHTLVRAEQFGLPIDEIVAEARSARPANIDAYVQAICRRRLKHKLPGLSDDLARQAFGRGSGAYTQVVALLSMVP